MSGALNHAVVLVQELLLLISCALDDTVVLLQELSLLVASALDDAVVLVQELSLLIFCALNGSVVFVQELSLLVSSALDDAVVLVQELSCLVFCALYHAVVLIQELSRHELGFDKSRFQYFSLCQSGCWLGNRRRHDGGGIAEQQGEKGGCNFHTVVSWQESKRLMLKTSPNRRLESKVFW